MTVLLISSFCAVWNPLIPSSLPKPLSPSQRLRELSISASLTHILLLHHPETVTHNQRDLSAPCSSFERSWNKLISPHLLRTSVLRFLHSNLLIVDATRWHDYVGNAVLMSTMNTATDPFLVTEWHLSWGGGGGLSCKSTRSIRTILGMRINTGMTADCLGVTGHYC